MSDPPTHPPTHPPTWLMFVFRGFTSYLRDDYLEWKREGRLVNDGVNAKASVMNDQRIWLAVFYRLDCIASVLLCSSSATMDLWMSARLARSSRGLLACGVCLCIPVHDHYCVFLSVMILGGLDSS